MKAPYTERCCERMAVSHRLLLDLLEVKMKIAEKEVILRDGRRILLRSPGAADAGQMLENMRVCALGETAQSL